MEEPHGIIFDKNSYNDKNAPIKQKDSCHLKQVKHSSKLSIGYVKGSIWHNKYGPQTKLAWRNHPIEFGLTKLLQWSAWIVQLLVNSVLDSQQDKSVFLIPSILDNRFAIPLWKWYNQLFEDPEQCSYEYWVPRASIRNRNITIATWGKTLWGKTENVVGRNYFKWERHTWKPLIIQSSTYTKSEFWFW